MLLCVVSFSSCGDDDDAGTLEQDLVINLSKEHEVVEIGKTIQLVAGFSPSDAPNKAHTWTSEDPQIATVDETGKVMGVSVGTTKITVTALANKATATCEIEVVDKIIPVTSVTLNSKEETISVGSAIQLTATVSPTTATNKNIVWTSSNNVVATVDGNGLVKGLSVGSANITAAAGGKSAVCAVTVTEKSVDFSNIEFTVQADGSLLVSGTVKPVGVNVSEIGACFSTETTPTIEHNKHVLTTTGLTVNNEISDLAPGSYYARLYAKGDGNIYYGKSIDIKILEQFISQFKLIESFYDEYDGAKKYSLKLSSPNPKDLGYSFGVSYCYGVAPNPEITDNIATFQHSGDCDIIYLENLSSAKKYYIRAWSEKNRKPIYFSGEASFATLGFETKITATFLSASRRAQPWLYRINYTLAEKGTYEVTLRDYGYKCYIGKSRDNLDSKTLYVADGTGEIYLSTEHWSTSYGYYNGSATIIFENMDSGAKYVIHLGDNYTGS